jgi:putative flippase GtrA
MVRLLKKLWALLFFRFVMVGLLNTLVGYGFFALFIGLHADYKMAILLATILGALFNFKSTGQIVFDNRKNRLIFKFVFVYGIVYVANLYAVKVLLIQGVNVLFSQALALPLVVVLSFFLQKKFVFRIKHYGR